MRIPDRSLFIADLGRDFRPDALRCGNDNTTTLAVGEEGGGATTMALGEEGGGDVTTLALGEEGGGDVTTMALGEEGCTDPTPCDTSTPLARLLDLFVRDFGR